MKASLLFFINGLLLAIPAAAQLSITAQVNKDSVGLDDQVVLAVTVTGHSASLPDPLLPVIPNFSIYSSGKSHSISIINGRMAATATHTYVLVPRAVGKGVIPPVKVMQGTEQAATGPIEIQVTPSAQQALQQQRPPTPTSTPGGSPAQQRPAANAPDVYVTAQVDKPRAYVNEQVTLTVRFHTAINLLGNPEYQAPQLSGFLTEDLPPLRHLQLQRGGRTYYVTELKTALFPLQAGKLRVGAATVRVQVQRDMAIDPTSPDFFERFFSQGLAGGELRELASDPLTLEALPLPEQGKPADFSGAVGEYTANLQADKKAAKVGEAVTITLTIAGRGNLKALGEVRLPDMPSWRVFDPVPAVGLKKEDDVVRGSKAIKFVAVPRVSGELTVPKVSLAYFDPSAKAYKRAETAALKMAVAPGDPNAAGPAVSFTGGGGPKGLTNVTEDIRHVKARTGPSPASRALAAFANLGPVHSVPALFLAAVLGAGWRRRELERDPRRARARAALKGALDKLDSPLDALLQFLGDKLGEPPAALTQKRAAELLAARKVDASELRKLWAELEARRYAPGAGGAEDLRKPLEDLLRRLDKELPS